MPPQQLLTGRDRPGCRHSRRSWRLNPSRRCCGSIRTSLDRRQRRERSESMVGSPSSTGRSRRSAAYAGRKDLERAALRAAIRGAACAAIQRPARPCRRRRCRCRHRQTPSTRSSQRAGWRGLSRCDRHELMAATTMSTPYDHCVEQVAVAVNMSPGRRADKLHVEWRARRVALCVVRLNERSAHHDLSMRARLRGDQVAADTAPSVRSTLPIASHDVVGRGLQSMM